MTLSGHSVEYAVQQVGIENQGFAFFNREPDVKLSVRRCRVQVSFRGRDAPAT